jgi:hypothetical protein
MAMLAPCITCWTTAGLTSPRWLKSFAGIGIVGRICPAVPFAEFNFPTTFPELKDLPAFKGAATAPVEPYAPFTEVAAHLPPFAKALAMAGLGNAATNCLWGVLRRLCRQIGLLE